jgi:hypothetical protein
VRDARNYGGERGSELVAEIKAAGRWRATFADQPLRGGAVGAVIGYTRVSTVDQNLDSQPDTLQKAGAVRVFTDKLSG